MTDGMCMRARSFITGWSEGEIFYNGMEYEFEIDADSGNILKWEEERW